MSGAPSAFPATRWTLIRSAQSSPEARQAALAELMRSYWRPLYVFFRHKNLSPAAAQDAVQDLLVQLLERDVLAKLSEAKGRLRGYLKAMASNLLINQHAAAVAQKRGGAATLLPLDVELAERLVQLGAHPDQAFEAEWAAAVMERALEKLEAEFRSGLRGGSWELAAQFFRPGEPAPYRELSAAHGLSVPALKAFVHRARVRYRELLREECADTLDEGGDPDAEVQSLFAALSP